MCSKFPSRPATDGTRQSFAILDFTENSALMGTGYTGEMKKAFSLH
jgi:ATP-dependent phosphoenolpyruvate carboxykinase